MDIEQGFLPIIPPDLYFIHPHNYYGVRVGSRYTFIKRPVSDKKINNAIKFLKEMELKA